MGRRVLPRRRRRGEGVQKNEGRFEDAGWRIWAERNLEVRKIRHPLNTEKVMLRDLPPLEQKI
jgi:hypothetical protein